MVASSSILRGAAAQANAASRSGGAAGHGVTKAAVVSLPRARLIRRGL
jgi:hypothetical protein